MQSYVSYKILKQISFKKIEILKFIKYTLNSNIAITKSWARNPKIIWVNLRKLELE